MRERGSLYIGVLLLLLGAIFLVAQWGETFFRPLGLNLGWGAVWPFLVILAGVAFWLPIAIWWERRGQLAGLAVPGTIVLVNGLLLLYQNTTGDWESWSYLWTLEPIAVGLGLGFLYLLLNRPSGLLVAAGVVGGIGLVFFVIFASLFGGILRLLGPAALILAGLLLVLVGLGWRAQSGHPRE